ncbi:hypothetical protein [Streptomyces erythrochromogenes]|uniref:hypothetical protein n=1 Tax=Streptomyces erythrochromogenes TaxID=285574 RepID=UPI00380B25CB
MNQRTRVRDVLHAAFPHVESDDPVGFFSEEGDVMEALKYAYLYWPNLFELHGAVFLALQGDDERETADRLSTPVADGQSGWGALSWTGMVDSYNVFEVEQLFRRWRGPAEVSEDAHRALGEFLVQMWSARLAAAYPSREFAVRLIEADEDMDLRIQVTQQHPPLTEPGGWDGRRRGVISDV